MILRPLRRSRIITRFNKKDGSVRLSAEYDVVIDRVTGETDE